MITVELTADEAREVAFAAKISAANYYGKPEQIEQIRTGIVKLEARVEADA